MRDRELHTVHLVPSDRFRVEASRVDHVLRKELSCQVDLLIRGHPTLLNGIPLSLRERGNP